MKKIGYKETVNWYEKHAVQYAQKSKTHFSSDLKQLEDFSSLLPAKGIVLDAGCGSGRDTNIFQEKGFNVIGLDISKNLLAEARKAYPKSKFTEGDILNLPFEENNFDAVWAHAAIVHFDKDEQVKKALSEFSRTLKRGGLLHILVRAQKQGGKKREVLKDSVSNGKRYYRNFSKDETEELLTNAGFSKIKVFQYNESELDPQKRPGEGIEWLLVSAEKR